MGQEYYLFWMKSSHRKPCTFFLKGNRKLWNYHLPNMLSPRNITTKEKSPFFIYHNEEGTLRCFLDALSKNSGEDALVYFSKEIQYQDNLEEALALFGEERQYKKLIHFKQSKNKRFNTISIALGKQEKVIHVYLVEEPDKFSQWKIIQIERG